MADKFENVYQFKITLLETDPPIWRRFQVPENYNFQALHFTAQDVMGWHNCHCHQFNAQDPDTKEEVLIGVPDDLTEIKRIPEQEAKISKYFPVVNQIVYYEYDFGDSWEHMIVLESIHPRQAKLKYPICLEGERACPPEDVGGVDGYEEHLKIIKNRKHEEHKERMEWLKLSGYKNIKPEVFNAKKVDFYLIHQMGVGKK